MQEHFGEIKGSSYNFEASAQQAQPGKSVLVFDIEGSKGKGQVTVVTEPGHGDTINIESGTVRTPAGNVVPLLPGNPIPGLPQFPGPPQF